MDEETQHFDVHYFARIIGILAYSNKAIAQIQETSFSNVKRITPLDNKRYWVLSEELRCSLEGLRPMPEVDESLPDGTDLSSHLKYKIFREFMPRISQGEDKRKFSIYLFLPDAKDGLPALVEKIGSESGFLENHLPNRQVKVGAFSIPKFKISFGFEASEVLKGLGLVLPFSGDGLTEMVDSPTGQNLYVSSIFHKSFIEVNEEGTEAAAATAGVIKQRSLTMEDNLDFVADHPFLFVVREDMTGVVLFIGQIHNPLSC
ncbi:serpin-ZXA-like [Olea europaea var. sylvestris]|uniref:serpin-ZXA-like n=1 Tax=Olea europaea var. sylvestris TaxID=158386 RepID=UPI000C1CF959|nr:serpin-ZXA-like [Olea europaea var. sylvestris]